jgi:hypothetical protein
MIDLGTLAGLLEYEHQVAAYSAACERWRVPPLAELVAACHAARRLPVGVQCRHCGGIDDL